MRPDVEWPKKRSVLAVPPLQQIQKLKVRTLKKCQSLNSLLTLALFTTFTFWFHFFRSADKIDEDDAFVHLILPPPSPAT